LLKAKRDTNGFREIVGKFPQTAGVDGPVATNRTARILGAFTKERARTLFGEMERWWTERLDGGLWPSGKTASLNAGRSLTVETEERVHGAPRLHLPVVTTNGTVRCVLPVPLFDMCVTTNGTARFSGVFTEAQARTLADEMARWLTERFAEGPSRSGEKSTPAPAFGRRAGGSM
jgi:hypothetical protein